MTLDELFPTFSFIGPKLEVVFFLGGVANRQLGAASKLQTPKLEMIVFLVLYFSHATVEKILYQLVDFLEVYIMSSVEFLILYLAYLYWCGLQHVFFFHQSDVDFREVLPSLKITIPFENAGLKITSFGGGSLFGRCELIVLYLSLPRSSQFFLTMDSRSSNAFKGW